MVLFVRIEAFKKKFKRNLNFCFYSVRCPVTLVERYREFPKIMKCQLSSHNHVKQNLLQAIIKVMQRSRV